MEADQRPHVAILGTRGYPSYYGGFETAVRHLAPYLVDAGWRVTVYGRRGQISADYSGTDTRVETVEVRGVPSKSLSTLTTGYLSSRHARRARPDVALVMNVANGFFLRGLGRANVRTVVNVDGLEWERAKWGRAARAVFRAGARATARHASELVCDAREIQRRWSEDFGRSGVFIPYGADFDRYPEGVSGFEPGSYVLVVARFVPENSIVEIFEAVPRIAQGRSVVLVGSSGFGGEFDSRAKALSESLVNVHWLGHVRDDARLYALWRDAGVYIHGHSVGGTNPALVQAMACGAPVVARDTPYNREVLPASARFFDASCDGIVEAVESVLGDDLAAATMRSDNRARAQERYTWEGVCRDYEVLLRSVAQ